MKFDSFLKTMIGLTLATQAVTPAAFAQQAGFTTSAQEQKVNKSLLALSDSQKLALNLMIAATILDQQGVNIARVDERIAKKYMSIKANSIDLSLAGSATGVAGYATYSSSKRVESVSEMVTALLRLSARGLKASSEVSEKILRAVGVVWLLENSSEGSTWSYNNLGIKQVMEWSSKRGVREFIGATGAISVAGTSIMYLMNDTNEAISYTMLRRLLGQDDEMRKRVDANVEILASIFNLSASGKDTLKLAIYDEVLRQAVENKFSTDATKYKLDVVELMAKNNLIDQASFASIQKLRSIAKEISPTSDLLDVKRITLENVEMSLALAALLEQQVASQTIRDAQTLRNIQTLLGSVHAKLALIGFNLQK